MPADLKAIHRTRLETMRGDADAIAGTALRLAQAIQEVLDTGGTVKVQPQINFLTGAVLRMVKDWGVVEQLQSYGVVQKRRL